MRHVFALLLAAILSGNALGDLRLPSCFGDHMVIQRGAPIPVWGWAEPGARVDVSFGEWNQWAVAADDGSWYMELAPLGPSATPRTMIIASEGISYAYGDVLVGDVWICSGQSNMYWKVHSSDRYEEFAAAADRPTLRMFNANLVAAASPQDDLPGSWAVSTPETVGAFSAAAYHFGVALSDAIEVPIGLIHTSWGGSTAQAWIPQERLATTDPGRRTIKAWNAYASIDRDARKWADAGIDDRTWKDATIPGRSAIDFDGVFWYRIDATIPEHWAGRDLALSLGMIDDNEVTYFNGVEVGSTNGHAKPRHYVVPAEVARQGDAVIAVRVHDTGGPGGFWSDSGDLYLHPVGDQADRISLSGAARMKIASTSPGMPQQHRPSQLYNGMIYPLLHLNITGATWYQGESNAIGQGAAEDYAVLLPAMIESWRESWDMPAMPFMIVQLANWDPGDSNWDFPGVREVQRLTHESMDHTGLAVITDIGDSKDIHPRNKHDVGDRLARWALADVYKRWDVVKAGPMPRSIEII